MADLYSEHAELSPSAASRWLNCTASVIASRGADNEDSVYAIEGTEAHRQLELWLSLGVPPVDGQLYEELEHAYTFALDLEQRGYDVQYEVRLKYDEDIWGTGDIVGIKGKRIVIGDYKHGYVPVEAKHNPQMATYAIAAEKTVDKSFTDIELVVIQPRMPHRDGPVRKWPTDSDWLDWYKQQVHVAKLEIYGNDPQFRPGRHCRYCPILGSCKAAANYMSRIGTGEDLYV